MIRKRPHAPGAAFCRTLLIGCLTAASALCQAQSELADPRSQQLSKQLTQLALTLPAEAFAQALPQFLDSGLPPEQLGAVLRQTLLELRSQPSSGAGRWLVDYLISAPAPAIAPHPERAAVNHDPLGLSAVAQGTRNSWIWRSWRQRTITLGNQGAWQLLDELTRIEQQAGPEAKAALNGVVAGVRQLSPAALSHPELNIRLLAHPALAPITLAVATITADSQLLLKASQSWPAAEQAALTLKLESILGLDNALSVWRRQLVAAGPARPYARVALARLLRENSLPTAQSRELQALLEQHR